MDTSTSQNELKIKPDPNPSENKRRVVIKIVVQNLQKRKGLASELVAKLQPDIFLAQEINLSSEGVAFSAYYTNFVGYGTAIYSKKDPPTKVRKVCCPHAEFGGFLYKLTTVAECMGIQFVSFHGYNGLPFKNITKLVDHVLAVLKVLEPGPCLFAGDFNTWTREHYDSIKKVLVEVGFEAAFSWAYPGKGPLPARTQPLDHAFVRGVRLEDHYSFPSASDHRGAVLEISVV